MLDKGDTVTDMNSEYPILHDLPDGPARVGDVAIHCIDSKGVMVARDGDEPWLVSVQMPIGNGIWIGIKVTAETAHRLGDELYMQAGKAEKAAKERFDG